MSPHLTFLAGAPHYRANLLGGVHVGRGHQPVEPCHRFLGDVAEDRLGGAHLRAMERLEELHDPDHVGMTQCQV